MSAEISAGFEAGDVVDVTAEKGRGRVCAKVKLGQKAAVYS